jgi:DNA-binding IclR family transcriptional regulator
VIEDELEGGLAELAVPVRSRGGDAAAILTITGPSYRVDAPGRARTFPALRDAAAELERLFAG